MKLIITTKKHLKYFVLLIISLAMLSYVVPAKAATGEVTKSMENEGPYTRYRWTFVESGGAAVDTAETYEITGKIVGVLFIETSITTATTVKLLDSVGRDVLQGIFTDTEASATATADNHYRVPVDDASGSYIVLFEEAVYLDISSGNASETGYVDVIVKTQ